MVAAMAAPLADRGADVGVLMGSAYLFTREIVRFVQFFVLAVAIAVIFYEPTIVRSLAQGIAHALGVH